MISYVTGNLLAADSEALVNAVNCVGVMGRGVALAFKRTFPANYKAYKAACDRGELQPGRMFVFETGEMMPRLIINFPTKRHWRARSRLADIEAGLSALVAEVERHRMHFDRRAGARLRSRRSRVDGGEAPHPSSAGGCGSPGCAGLRAVRHCLAAGAEVTGG